MKQMSRMVLVLAFCISSQAFGWVIEFKPNTYGGHYRILTFKRVRYFEELERGTFILNKINEASLEVLSLLPAAVGVVTDVTGAAKEAAKGKEAAVVSQKSNETVLALSEPKFSKAQKAIKEGSKFFKKIFEKSFLKPITYIARESKTTDYISDYKPNSSKNRLCRNAKSLKEDHMLDAHKIKSNQDILYVIYDKKKEQIMAAGLAPAYGYFTFELVEVVDETDPNNNNFKMGYLKKINDDGGKNCPSSK